MATDIFLVKQSIKIVEILYDQTGSVKSHIAASNRKHPHLSLYTNRNELLMGILMFSEFSNPLKLVGMMHDLTGSVKSNMNTRISPHTDQMRTKFQMSVKVPVGSPPSLFSTSVHIA